MRDKKHIVFDLDGTLTESRMLINDEMTEALADLEKLYDVVIISGAQKLQMIKQIPWLKLSSFTIMGQSGNDTTKEGQVLFRHILGFEEINVVLSHLADIHKEYKLGEGVEIDTLEARGGQISWSKVGHNTDRGVKVDYDPKGDKRREMLKKVPFNSERMMVRIGGTTTLDYTKVGWGKKGNLEKLFKLNGWKFEDAIYVGDQLYEGGNDEDVIEIMDTVSVENPDEALEYINQELNC